MENTVEMLEPSVEDVTPVSAELQNSSNISFEDDTHTDEPAEEEEGEEKPEETEESDVVAEEEEVAEEESEAGEEETEAGEEE